MNEHLNTQILSWTTANNQMLNILGKKKPGHSSKYF